MLNLLNNWTFVCPFHCANNQLKKNTRLYLDLIHEQEDLQPKAKNISFILGVCGSEVKMIITSAGPVCLVPT